MASRRGEYTEKRLSGLRELHQRMKVLGEGESSHTHRIRASEAVNEWFKSLSAEERGRLITSLYEAQTSATPVDGGEGERPVAGATPVDTQAEQQLETGATPVIQMDWEEEATSATPVKVSPHKKLSGKAAELFDLLSRDGAVMVKAGNRYEVRRGGEVLGSFGGATGGALLTREGLLTPVSADSWILSSRLDF